MLGVWVAVWRPRVTPPAMSVWSWSESLWVSSGCPGLLPHHESYMLEIKNNATIAIGSGLELDFFPGWMAECLTSAAGNLGWFNCQKVNFFQLANKIGYQPSAHSDLNKQLWHIRAADNWKQFNIFPRSLRAAGCLRRYCNNLEKMAKLSFYQISMKDDSVADTCDWCGVIKSPR